MSDDPIFAPYVPLTTTPVVLDPNNFNPSPVMMRYSMPLLLEGSRQYRTISLGELVGGVRKDCTKVVDWKKDGF